MGRPNTGSIRKRRAGVWEIAASFRRMQNVVDTINRTSRQLHTRRTETVYGSKADAERRLRELLVSQDRGELPLEGVSVEQWLEHWYRAHVQVELAPNSQRIYRGALGP